MDLCHGSSLRSQKIGIGTVNADLSIEKAAVSTKKNSGDSKENSKCGGVSFLAGGDHHCD